MNNDFPLLSLTRPEIFTRRRDRPSQVPLSPEILARRQEIARRLSEKITPLSNSIREMSDEERKAIFLKIEHERAVQLPGLKRVAEPTERFTLAVPLTDNLDQLVAQVQEFGAGELKRGHAPHEHIAAIKTIQEGEPKDRLSEVLLEQYDKLIKQDWVRCEIEMISLARGKNQQREELLIIRSNLEKVFANCIYGNIFEHEEIKGTCRAVIRCTGPIFQRLVEEREWQTQIFWFDARPEFETFHSTLQNFNIRNLGPISSPPDDAPIVCIVDSGVTIGSPFLEPVVREDLLRSFLKQEPDNPYDEHGHGSGVASLASYYALNLSPGASNEGKVWIASARVLDKNNELEDEEPRLFSKVLAEVVDTFVPLGVRIFNLSVGILNRKWNAEAKRTVPRRSWIARTIDRLCREKDIIFVISTGNLKPWHVRNYWQDEKPYPAYFADEQACILDPGQAALALTVGSIAPGTLATGKVGTEMAIAEKNQPSPFTRCGPGIGREIKPELVELGGNYFLGEDGSVRLNPGTNVVMASHQITDVIAHNSGTSFAAPRVVYKLAQVLSDLQALGLDHVSAPLLKAFIVNSASYRGVEGEFEHFREEMDAVLPKHWLNILGYGMPDHNQATYCDQYSAILFFQGELIPNKVAYFGIPVPASLADADRGIKRLTVTVVHAPQVQRWGLERYLGTTLKWRMFRGDVEREDIIKAMSIEEESEDNDEVDGPNELKFDPGITLRSRGTVQQGVFEWKNHRLEHSENFYTLAVAAYEKWSRENPDPVPYAVVVRLEDTTQTAPVYTEVQDLLARIEVQTRVRT
jgi:hypothetical protein